MDVWIPNGGFKKLVTGPKRGSEELDFLQRNPVVEPRLKSGAKPESYEPACKEIANNHVCAQHFFLVYANAD